VLASVSRGEEPEGGRHLLAAELVRLRRQAGVSGRELAARIGISQSKVSRIESARTIPVVPEVSAWVDALGASRQTRAQLVRMAEAVHTQVLAWRVARQSRSHLQDEIAAREAGATVVRTFQPSLVPGLLQTADYARRVFELGQIPYGQQDAAGALAARLDRQVALYGAGRKFEFLITESALRWSPGSARILAAQYDRIASLTTLENVSIGLIPLANRESAATSIPHSFIIYHGHDGGPDTFVTVETIHADVVVNFPDDVGLYEARWNLLEQTAIFGDEARRFLMTLPSTEG
jgi:transcriptional regulator with XRE-family HTH domain